MPSGIGPGALCGLGMVGPKTGRVGGGAFLVAVGLLWRREANVHAATMISRSGMSPTSSLRPKLFPGVRREDALATRLSVATLPRCLDAPVRLGIAFRLAGVPPNPF